MRKSKALREFKAEDSTVRVIMLSLKKAAAGTNLVAASHVILVDPVFGSKKEAQVLTDLSLFFASVIRAKVNFGLLVHCDFNQLNFVLGLNLSDHVIRPPRPRLLLALIARGRPNL